MVTRIKKSFTEIPQTLARVVTFITAIGRHQSDINELKRAEIVKIAAITQETNKKVAAITKKRNRLFTSLFAFAMAHKKALTAQYRTQKTIAGEFGWRWNTPSLQLEESVTDADIIKILKERGMTQYIRTVEELDKKALLKDKPIISGISYRQRDEFYIKPKLSTESGKSKTLSKTETIDS